MQCVFKVGYRVKGTPTLLGEIWYSRDVPEIALHKPQSLVLVQYSFALFYLVLVIIVALLDLNLYILERLLGDLLLELSLVEDLLAEVKP